MIDQATSVKEAEERKLARDSLVASSVYAESIFDTAREPLLLLNEELRVRAANRAFYEFFRVSVSETVGQRLFDLGQGQWNIPRLRELLEKILPANGSLLDVEVPHDFPPIGQRILLVNARRVLPATGPGEGIVMAIQDVTEKRQAQVNLERLNEELEERVRQRTAELETANRELLTANRELEAFSYSVSHDLRSPLRALDGYARILMDDHAATFSTEAQEFVRDIRRVAQRMGQLIDDLLSFSRLSRQGLEKRLVAPAPIIRKILEDHCAEQDARHIEVIVNELPRCHADPSLLKQVWVNLLSNAFKYTRKSDCPRIEIGCRVQDGEQIYFVRDNGVGFDMRYADKLFSVFQRLHKAAEFDGTGVGLAIVQRIIHRHGGRIWAEAAVNQGATFSFSLPILENLS